MEFTKKKTTRRLFPLTLIFLAIGVTCACKVFSLTSTPTSPPPQPVTPPPTQTTQVQPPTQTTQVQPALNLSAPWIIISSTDGLWAANPDGTSMLQLVAGNQWQSDFSRAIQPKGNLVVVITSGADRYHQLVLNLLSLPDGSLQKITDLTTAQTEPAPDAGPGTDALEAMRAISEQPSYSWSPDGTKLAFIGAMDGPSADVYLYDLNTRSITRVSTDLAQDYWPSWSPDGSHLLFFGADTFGTGAGYAMNGVWSANGDGSNVTLLYQPTSSGEAMLGWRDNEIAVLESWDPANGFSYLRLYNITTKKTINLQASPVSGAVADAGNVVSSTDPGAVLFSQATGLYLLPSNQTQPTQLSGSQVASVRWIPDSSMFEVEFHNGSLATFLSDGSHRQDAPAALSSAEFGSINVAMYGAIWGWTKSGGDTQGAWINGPGLDIPQIFSGPAVAPLWDPHNNLTFFSESTLYRVTFDSHYTDLGPVANVSGDVVDASWVGTKGFDIYGP